MQKNAPIGVKIISVLYIIGAVVIVLATIFLMYNVGSVIQPLSVPADSGLSISNSFDVFSLVFIIQGTFFIGIAVLSFFAGRGLWKGKNWAKIVAIIYSIFGIIAGLGGLMKGEISSILGLFFSAIIGGYLFFSKEVRQFFIDDLNQEEAKVNSQKCGEVI